MQPATAVQIEKLNSVYRKTRADLSELILDLTNGRTSKAEGLTKKEASELLEAVNIAQRRQLCQYIYDMAYNAGIIYGDSKLDMNLNRLVLTVFLNERSPIKKDIYTMTLSELKRTYDLMRVVVSNTTYGNEMQAAKAATDKLLTELKITVSTQ